MDTLCVLSTFHGGNRTATYPAPNYSIFQRQISNEDIINCSGKAVVIGRLADSNERLVLKGADDEEAWQGFPGSCFIRSNDSSATESPTTSPSDGVDAINPTSSPSIHPSTSPTRGPTPSSNNQTLPTLSPTANEQFSGISPRTFTVVSGFLGSIGTVLVSTIGIIHWRRRRASPNSYHLKRSIHKNSDVRRVGTDIEMQELGRIEVLSESIKQDMELLL